MKMSDTLIALTESLQQDSYRQHLWIIGKLVRNSAGAIDFMNCKNIDMLVSNAEHIIKQCVKQLSTDVQNKSDNHSVHKERLLKALQKKVSKGWLVDRQEQQAAGKLNKRLIHSLEKQAAQPPNKTIPGGVAFRSKGIIKAAYCLKQLWHWNAKPSQTGNNNRIVAINVWHTARPVRYNWPLIIKAPGTFRCEKVSLLKG